jgi:NAD(P)-dependent dehydrogenase (short-subunit alcohol dehydrogenase family)
MRTRTPMSGYLIGLTALAGLGVAVAISRRRRRLHYWQQKIVVVTGGSRGLGLELARVWLARGAKVAMCSRSQAELDRAIGILDSAKGNLFGHRCDVTDPDQLGGFFDEVVNRWGGIDALVNNAGIMTVGPLEDMTESDFQAAMETHFWAPLHAIQLALPYLKDSRGHVVNIASVGGKISVPHMLPYSASKFALVGLSEGLHTELAKCGVQITTVCPGLMRTGSPRNALFKGRHHAEYRWFSISGSLPGISIASDRAAHRIVGAVTQGRAHLTLSLPAKLAIGAHGIFPSLSTRVLGAVNRMLPGPGGIGQNAAFGKESTSSWSPSVLTALTEKAAARNNEVP